MGRQLSGSSEVPQRGWRAVSSLRRDLFIVFIVAMTAATVAAPFAIRYYRQRCFHEAMATLSELEGAPRVRGEFLNATMEVDEEISVEEWTLVEQCGPIARLNYFPERPLPAGQNARLLALPGLRDIWILSDEILSDDAIAGMCRVGREIRELNLNVKKISGPSLNAAGRAKPALEPLKIRSSGGKYIGAAQLAAAFPRLSKLELGPPVWGGGALAQAEITRLPNLKELRSPAALDRSDADRLAPNVVLADLPLLDTATVLINHEDPSVKISCCPKRAAWHFDVTGLRRQCAPRNRRLVSRFARIGDHGDECLGTGRSWRIGPLSTFGIAQTAPRLVTAIPATGDRESSVSKSPEARRLRLDQRGCDAGRLAAPRPRHPLTGRLECAGTLL